MEASSSPAVQPSSSSIAQSRCSGSARETWAFCAPMRRNPWCGAGPVPWRADPDAAPGRDGSRPADGAQPALRYVAVQESRRSSLLLLQHGKQPDARCLPDCSQNCRPALLLAAAAAPPPARTLCIRQSPVFPNAHLRAPCCSVKSYRSSSIAQMHRKKSVVCVGPAGCGAQKRRTAPKNRPPTIQAIVLFAKGYTDHSAALAASICLISSGTTLNRSPTMP